MGRFTIERDLSSVWWSGAEGPSNYDWSTLFGNSNPVELDLGCGRGLFLLNESQAKPGVNFIGVDYSRQYSRQAADLIDRHQIPNVRVICDTIWQLFPKFPDGSFQAIHVYFPDPWWKRRHRKRRVVSAPLVEQVHRLLPPGGRLCLATDVGEYFGKMLEVVNQSPLMELVWHREEKWSECEAPPPAVDSRECLTHFERKYRREGRTVWRAEYVRWEGFMSSLPLRSPETV